MASPTNSFGDFLNWAGQVYVGSQQAKNPVPQVTQAAPQSDNANAYVDAGNSPAAYSGSDAGMVNTGTANPNLTSVGGMVIDKRVLTVTGVAVAALAVAKLARGNACFRDSICLDWRRSPAATPAPPVPAVAAAVTAPVPMFSTSPPEAARDRPPVTSRPPATW
ncbi:hypothetical protein [Microbulbifer taiwanensis]|uniref:Uncharacterized protein n=1 Tax=Microbulbifer taiwanensis TaxID=986746 RepID=A0ABW1YSN6_9GAMM